MKQLKYIVLLFALIAASACDLEIFRKNGSEEPVARVVDKHLYRSDFISVTDGLNKNDSAIVAKRYIDTWVKEQLMLYRAELALSEEQKDFEKQIEEYRKSLLIYSYRQKLLQQKLDTVVTAEEITAYYEKNITNFHLSEDIIKGTYVKVSLSAPRINDVASWSRSNTEDALIELEKYCISYAEKYSDFNNDWIFFSSIKDQIPVRISAPSRYLRYNKNIVGNDSLYRYYLHISDHLIEGDVTPLEMISDDIRSILLNKRKLEFVQDLESRVYNDGVSKNQFEIY